jgi:putative membrane protein insertion efficiency factor
LNKLVRFPYIALKNLPASAAVTLISGYQLLVSPVLPGTCRFHPTCSKYAGEAFTQYGVFKGAWLSLKRIGRCHPWGEPGFDPVPKHVHNQAGNTSCHRTYFKMTENRNE